MYKFLVAFLAAVLAVNLSGCAKESPQLTTGKEIEITFPETEPLSSTMVVTAPTVPEPEPEPEPEPIPEPDADDFVRILAYIPSARQVLRYATTDNFTGQVIYQFEDAYLRYGTVKKLMAVAEELEKQGLGLLIWDGYRPVYAQQALFDVYPDPTYVSPPGVGNQNHCRGRAVDLTLYDLKTGEELEMPSGFDDFSKQADRNYDDVPAQAAENARILEKAMTNHGFKGYGKEWWHYNDTADYLIEEVFDPAVH